MAARELAAVEVWSDLEAVTGAERLAVFPAGAVHRARETVETERHQLELQLRRDIDAWDSIDSDRVVRIVFSDDSLREFRIRRVGERHETDDEVYGSVRADSILNDLVANSELVERVEENGDASGVFPLSVTVSEHVDHILTYAPDYFSKGTVDPTEEVTFQYRWDSPLRALREIAGRVGAELEAERQADGTYLLHVLDQVGSGVEKTHLRVRKNLLEIEHEADAREQATRLTPIGGGPDVAPADISDNGWIVSSVSGSEVFLTGAPIGFDDQLSSMGAYLEKADGTTTEITSDSKADQSVTVADATGISAGDRVRVVRNAAGDDLTYLEDPDAVASYGVKADTFERSDLPAVNNLVTNGFLADWTSGMPDAFDKVGSPTVSRETSDPWTQLGGSSAHVTAAEGEGLQTDIIDIDPTGIRPFFSGQAKFYLLSGAVRLVIEDVTNGEEWPKKGTKEEGVSSAKGWNENFAIEAPEDFDERSTTQVRLKLVAHGGSAEFYFDAAGLVQSNTAPDTFFEGFASNQLWEAANEELLTRALPSHAYRVAVSDLERLDPDAFPHETLQIGATVQVYDPEVDADFSSRIVRLIRNLRNPAESEVEISNRIQDLAGLLGSVTPRGLVGREPAQPSSVPGDVDSGTVAYDFTDHADVRWASVANAAAYLLRWAPASSSTAWENANKLPEVPSDEATIPRDRIVDEIGDRSFDLLIKARNENGVESRNAATVLIENPAPDASEIASPGDWSSSHEASAIRVEVDVTDTEASRIRLHGRGVTGFTPGEDTLIGVQEIDPGQTTVGFQFKVPESIASDLAPVEEGDTAFFVAELVDELTAPLGESSDLSAETELTIGLETGVQPPQWGLHLQKQVNSGDVQGLVNISWTDLQGRISGTAFTKSPIGGGAWSPSTTPDSSWDTVDTSSPFQGSFGPFDLHPKHPREVIGAIRWKDQAGVHHWETQPATFDQNQIAQGSILDVSYRSDGTPEIMLSWDDDLDHFRFTFNAGTTGSVSEPADPTSGDNRFPGSGSISNGRLVLSSTKVEEDETLWIKLAGVRSDGTIATGKHILEARVPRSTSPQAPTVEFDTSDPTPGDNQIDLAIDAVAGKGGDSSSLQIEYQLFGGFGSGWGATQGPFSDPHTISNLATDQLVRARGIDTSLPSGRQKGEWKAFVAQWDIKVPESGEDLPRTPGGETLDRAFHKSGAGDPDDLSSIPDGGGFGKVDLDALGGSGEIDLGASLGWLNKHGGSLVRGAGETLTVEQASKLDRTRFVTDPPAEIYTYDTDTSALTGVAVGIRKEGSGVGSSAVTFDIYAGAETFTNVGDEQGGLNGDTLYHVAWNTATDSLIVDTDKSNARGEDIVYFGSITSATDIDSGGGGAGPGETEDGGFQ